MWMSRQQQSKKIRSQFICFNKATRGMLRREIRRYTSSSSSSSPSSFCFSFSRCCYCCSRDSHVHSIQFQCFRSWFSCMNIIFFFMFSFSYMPNYCCCYDCYYFWNSKREVGTYTRIRNEKKKKDENIAEKCQTKILKKNNLLRFEYGANTLYCKCTFTTV